MCCFSQPVELVSGTKIFARAAGPGAAADELLAYALSMYSSSEVAMILPLPVPPNSPESAVSFIDLSDTPDFFARLDTLFEPPMRGRMQFLSADSPRQQLVVHDVGAFEASFVPTIADFARLDPRFTLRKEVWASLPQYADWGFAVFKLKTPSPAQPAPTAGSGSLLNQLFGFVGMAPAPRHEATPFHPMAFRFPRRDPSTLFFPTVHIHDGTVQRTAHFDHLLYAQLNKPPAAAGPLPRHDREGQWSRSLLDAHPDSGSAAARLVATGQPVFRIRLEGTLPNADTLLPDP